MKTPHLLLLAPTLALALAGCSVDILPVHYSRVKSAKKASEPLQRGPDAPGAFHLALEFQGRDSLRYDPAKIEVKNGVARLKDASVEAAILETEDGAPFIALDALTEVTAPGHQGEIRYQLSPDSSTWYRFDGKDWVTAGPSYRQANTSAELKEAITSFHKKTGPGSVFLKVFLVAPRRTENVAVAKIELQGIAPAMDSWH